MDRDYLDHLSRELEGLKEQGLFKEERVIASPQDAVIRAGGREVLNFCANNYLGLANHPRLVEAALAALPKHGYGMASVATRMRLAPSARACLSCASRSFMSLFA